MKIKSIKLLARKLLVLYWLFHENCRFFKGLEITRTNGCLILSEVFRKKTRVHGWFFEISNNHTALLRIVTVKSWCHRALVWPSNPRFILNSSVIVKWEKLGTVSWNWVSVQKIDRMLFWQGSISWSIREIGSEAAGNANPKLGVKLHWDQIMLPTHWVHFSPVGCFHLRFSFHPQFHWCTSPNFAVFYWQLYCKRVWSPVSMKLGPLTPTWDILLTTLFLKSFIDNRAFSKVPQTGTTGPQFHWN
jgi:hypothetical protein